jgi:putative FmdB family regulatory protein
MPLYDYRCEKCGEVFEVRQSFSDPTLTVHEACGGNVKRMISVPALQFKGTGWYVTDYGRGGKTPATNGKSEASSESKSEPAKTESKTETKSEPKSETKPAAKSSPAEK